MLSYSNSVTLRNSFEGYVLFLFLTQSVQGCFYPRSLGASVFRQHSRVIGTQGSIKRLKPAIFSGPSGSIREPGLVGDWGQGVGHAKAHSNPKNEFRGPTTLKKFIIYTDSTRKGETSIY